MLRTGAFELLIEILPIAKLSFFTLKEILMLVKTNMYIPVHN